MKPLISIDPGHLGGIATLDATGTVTAEPMPDGMTAQADRLRELAKTMEGATVVLEKVGAWMPGDHPNSAAKFARHCGHLEAVAYVLGLPTVQVAPITWQKCLGTLPREKPERKRAIKEAMQRRHPHLTVSLCTADALAILEWARAKAI